MAIANRELEGAVSTDLVERIGRGDPAAERQMCERYYQRLLYFIRRRTGGDAALAEDICQQTFLKVLEKLRNREVREAASLAAYLHGVAVNDVMNETRKSTRRATEADIELVEQVADSASGPLDRLSDAQVQTEVNRGLQRLSSSDRDVLVRLYLREENRESICASEGYSPRQLNNIVWRAKERLKQHLLEQADKTEGRTRSSR